MSRTRLAFRTWIPALGWTAMTVVAAGDLLSAEHTSAWLWHLVRFLVGHTPTSDNIVIADFIFRKTGHFVNYAILSWLWFRAFRYWELHAASRDWTLRWAARGWALAVATACADEFVQSFSASRTSSVRDVLLDATGALAIQVALMLFARRRRGDGARPAGA